MKIRIPLISLCALFLSGAPALLSQTSVSPLDSILKSHRVGAVAPISVEMTGRVERDGKAEPFRLLATSGDELRIDYGTGGQDTLVLSNKLNFRDDGRKISYQKTPAGFSHLDITGLFLVQHLRDRVIRVEDSMDEAVVGGVPARRIRVEGDRTEKHRGNIVVHDRVDLYVTRDGLLAGVARTFYEGRPERYTQAFAFSNYKETEGVLLPYRIDVSVKAKLRQTFFVEAYRFDVSMDPETFISRRTR